MTDLKIFINGFCAYFDNFPFTYEFKDEHNLCLYFGPYISSVFLCYLVRNLPDSCSFYVSSHNSNNYICVYDD